MGLSPRRTTFAWILCLSSYASAGDLNAVAQPLERADASEPAAVRVELSWANAWRNDRNHDAVWVVLRSRGESAKPLRLAAEGHEVLNAEPVVQIVPSEDGVGAFIELAEPVRSDGDVTCTLVLRLGDASLPPKEVDVWAVEMVYVPSGPFDLGDDHEGVRARGGFHAVDERGRPTGPFHVESEDAIGVAQRPGCLWYEVGDAAQYIGDQSGEVPDTFPKGVHGFYVMKYELSQGQYARFLRALPGEGRAARVPLELEGEETETNTIGSDLTAEVPRRPCNFVTWDDTCAWTDWMGLRPMTEFEFEKAARGPKRPVPGDFPWGTASREGVRRVVLEERDLALATRDHEARLDDDAREEFAASYYWVMDLSGSLWERVISAGHPVGRAFRGSHGDGVLDGCSATNADWPRMSSDRAAPGIGYRGGAEYFGGEPNETNPFSCVGTRQYAGWDGAFRYKTYSARACRTAPAATEGDD